MVSTLKISEKTIFLFNEIKNREAQRRGTYLKHEDFLSFLLALYKQVEGDSVVFNTAWEKVKKRIT